MSMTDSLMASIMIGTIMGTLILDNTRRALARISWLGSYTHISNLAYPQNKYIHKIQI